MSVSDRIAIQDHGRVRQIGSPEEVYNVPHDVFIATFMGRGTLLGGEVTSTEGGVHMKIGNITLQGLDSTGRIKKGDRAACVIRPENYSVEEPSEPANELEGEVEWASFIGPYTEVRLDVDGNKVLVDIPPELDAPVGGRFKVYISHKNTIMLPLED
jgi:ABC-type Fe3+/spermidine/putrescine transport system ATPase subunit